MADRAKKITTRDGETHRELTATYIRASRGEKYEALKTAIETIKAYLKDHHPDAVIVPSPDVKRTSQKLEDFMSGNEGVIRMMDIRFNGPYDRDDFTRAMFHANEEKFPKFLIVVLPGFISNSCSVSMRRRRPDQKKGAT